MRRYRTQEKPKSLVAARAARDHRRVPLAAHQRLRFGAFDIDGATRCVSRDGQRLALRPKTFAVLEHLVLNAGRLVTKDELLDAVWPRVIVTEDSLTRCISEIRAALAESCAAGGDADGAIRTMARQGYLFEWPVQTADAHAGPGPAPAATGATGRLLGRESDLERLRAMLDEREGVTLAGPGGVGKSSLARELLLQRRREGAGQDPWIDLAPLPVGSSAEAIASALAAQLGLPIAGADLPRAVALAIESLPLLLMFDNAEHVADELAGLLPRLRTPASRWRWVVTSQQPLQVWGEQVLWLAPLALPPADCPAEALAAHAASALFLRRAAEADANFVVAPQHGPQVAQICRRLDGLPFALELAAAQAPWLGVDELARQLSDRASFLQSRRRDAHPRQRSLQAALAWSHDLLPDTERTVYWRLAVFPAAFTLAMARAVASDEVLSPGDVQHALEHLVQRSLVQVIHHGGTRLTLLETARADAAARLEASGGFDDVMRRLVRHGIDELGLAVERMYRDALAMDAFRESLQPLVQAALSAWRWASRHEPERAVALAVPLVQVLGREAPHEGRRLVDGSEQLLGDGIGPALMAGWQLEAALDRAATRTAAAREHARAAAQRFRALGNRVGLYRALAIGLYCESALVHGRAEGDQTLRELDEVEERNWPPQLLAHGANSRACWASACEDFDAAIAWRERTLALHEAAQSTWRSLVARANLTDSLLAADRVDEAIACGEGLLERVEGTPFLASLPALRLNLAGALLRQGQAPPARPLAEAGWAQAVDLGWQPYWADHLALLAALEGRPRTAALLLGYADAGYAAAGVAREVNEARAADEASRRAGASVGGPALQAVRERGRSLGDQDAARLAFATMDAR